MELGTRPFPFSLPSFQPSSKPLPNTMIEIKTLPSLPLPARVFYRVDYNVPLDGARIADATRIEETLPTLRLLREKGCPVGIASHLGRPQGERQAKYSLEPVTAKLPVLLQAHVPR